MKKPVTLKAIQQTWNLPALANMSNLQLSCSLLSDTFNKDLADFGCGVQSMGESTLGKFVNGNLRDKKGRAFANVSVTESMLEELLDDAPVPYRDEQKMPPRTCRESMLCNIRRFVDQTRPAMTEKHPLFTRLSLMDETILKPGEKEQFEVLQQTIDALRAEGTAEALTYAVFLLVLTAVFRYKVVAYPELYDLESIRFLIRSLSAVEKPLIEGQAFFMDENYMNDYHVYLFRIGYNRLYGKAYMSMRLEEGKPQVKLTLYDKEETAAANLEPVNRLFIGTPFRSGSDEMVYAVMHDQNNKLGILTFQHQKFNFGAMYFRSGMLLYSSSDTRVPMAQRVLICSRKLGQEELPYVEGFLKTSGSTITLTEQQLQAFLKKYQNEEWFEKFEESFLPFINSHACRAYRFDASEILAYSLTDLNEQDRLRVMLALKGLPDSNRRESDTNINCLPPPDTHKLFR